LPAVVAAVLLLGGALRLTELLSGRPLWIDELMLALNVATRDFGGLLAPLDYDQHAPILFLWAVKGATLAGGQGELTLRAVPLLAGLLLPWLLWRIGLRLGGSGAGVGAAALGAVSLPLVYYAAELKPYGTDPLVTAVLLLLAVRVRESPDRLARWRQLALGGCIALPAASPAAFVLVGIAGALLVERAIRTRRDLLLRTLWLGVLWGACFLLLYAIVFEPGAHNPYLRRFWEGTFLTPGAPDLGARFHGLGSAILAPLSALPAGLPLRVGLAVLLLGWFVAGRRAGLSAALLLALPYFALGFAAMIGYYAISTRLLLALAPCAFLTAGLLLEAMARALRAPPPLASGLAVLLVLATAAPGVVANGRSPLVRNEGREVVRAVAADPDRHPVYIPATALPAWGFYSTDWRRPEHARLAHYATLARASGPAAPNPLLDVTESPPPSDLSRTDRDGRVELIGWRSGVAYHEPAGVLRAEPEPGWAAAEADRIAAAADPYVWVLGTHWSDRELPALRVALLARGLRPVESVAETGALAVRFRSR
jgi:4-amino-4-deoxy-L-arabinose transferase-like glycosyltransferase